MAPAGIVYTIGTMETILLVLVLVALIGGFAVLWNLLKRQGEAKRDDQSLLLLQGQLNELTRTLDTKLGESSKVLREQFGESAKIIREITQELVKVGEGQKQVMTVTDQLKNLQDILKNPKQRGVLGEYYLETVLKNVLPPGSYQMQYPFKDGTIVDAVVKTPEGIIPVDSKFSLENYNRILEAPTPAERERYETAFYNDLKMRIDETSKYIKPSEGTVGFAFMFIPSEAVYYDLLINKVGAIKSNTVSLIEYAAGQKKVMVVSPTTFLAYLQTVLQGLRALQIKDAAEKIEERVRDLSRHLLSFEEYHNKLGAHLGTSINMYNKASGEFRKIDKDVLKITGEAMGAEPMTIEGPATSNEE
jgi:DNA recombination protein RmuC